MRITQISPQTKKPLRENVFLDGKFGFGISVEARFEAHLKEGQEVSEATVRKIVFEDQVYRLLISSEKFLSFRPRSEKEVRDNLRRKLERGQFIEPGKILDAVVRKLRKLNLVNDTDFATWWVGQRQKFRPRGERLLRAELYAKGVPRSIIDKLFLSYQSLDSEIEKVATKKVPNYQMLPTFEARQKLSAYLARLGYDWDKIKPVVDKLLR